ncbi:MAG: hypothetical protein QXS96_08315, partial [Candidatus Caldarchaeum sp.]
MYNRVLRVDCQLLDRWVTVPKVVGGVEKKNPSGHKERKSSGRRKRMLRVRIRVPEVGIQPEGGPGGYGACGSRAWVRWGRRRRRLRDVGVKEVEVERWKCKGC